MRYDVLGIGNSLIDVLMMVEESVIDGLEFKKETMTLIDEIQLLQIKKQTDGYQKLIKSGGSVANTIKVLVQLGAEVKYVGKVGRDPHGVLFVEKLNNLGVDTDVFESGAITGEVTTFITPDAKKTFVTYLGAALTLDENDITEEMIKECRVLHLTGYQCGNPELKKAAIKAMTIAKKFKIQISFDLGSVSVIEPNRESFYEIIKEYVDILFANEAEAKALTNKEAKDAVEELSKLCDYAIVKQGSKGSLVKAKGELHKISAVEAKAIDTTGAGDAYSGGFLYGLTQGYNIDVSAKLGSIIAAKVVEKIGANLSALPLKEIHELLQNNTL